MGAQGKLSLAREAVRDTACARGMLRTACSMRGMRGKLVVCYALQRTTHDVPYADVCIALHSYVPQRALVFLMMFPTARIDAMQSRQSLPGREYRGALAAVWLWMHSLVFGTFSHLLVPAPSIRPKAEVTMLSGWHVLLPLDLAASISRPEHVEYHVVPGILPMVHDSAYPTVLGRGKRSSCLSISYLS